jgi:hypothetical protein
MPLLRPDGSEAISPTAHNGDGDSVTGAAAANHSAARLAQFLEARTA